MSPDNRPQRLRPPSPALLSLAVAGFRLSDLADAAGVTEATASRWLSGDRIPSGGREEIRFAIHTLAGEQTADEVLANIPDRQERQAA